MLYFSRWKMLATVLTAAIFCLLAVPNFFSADTLKKLGVKVEKKDMPFLMANGQTITRPMGFAIITVDKFRTIDEIVFAEPGDLQLLGSRTMEGFGAMVDPQNKRLVASGPIPAAVVE